MGSWLGFSWPLLLLSQSLRPPLRQSPGMATATATEATATAEDTTEDTMGRGLLSPLLRLSQVLMLSQRLMLTPTTDTVDTATVVATTEVTAEDTMEDTMGRGL